MPGWLWWVSRAAGCQPGWPQGGLGEGSWGCPAEQGLMGVSYPCSSEVFEPVFPQVFTCFCAGGWSGGSACILYQHSLPWNWPHSTHQITPHHVWFCCPPLFPAPGPWGQAVTASLHGLPPTPNSPLDHLVHVRGGPSMGVPREHISLGCGCPCGGAPGMQVLQSWG